MNPLKLWTLVLSCLAAGVGCDGTPAPATPADAAPDSATPDAATIDKAAHCAATFGSGLSNGFGRLDGTVLAVVRPTETRCAEPNSDHLVVQVTVEGAAYRMVVNVRSDGRNGTDTRMKYLELPHAALGEPWTEGWHPGVALDYPGDLGAHADAFTPHEMSELVELVTARVELGSRISVYAATNNKPSSAHLIHRNDGTPAADDGAIVIGPDTAEPLFLLFAFDGTSF